MCVCVVQGVGCVGRDNGIGSTRAVRVVRGADWDWDVVCVTGGDDGSAGVVQQPVGLGVVRSPRKGRRRNKSVTAAFRFLE